MDFSTTCYFLGPKEKNEYQNNNSFLFSRLPIDKKLGNIFVKYWKYYKDIKALILEYLGYNAQ